MLVASDVVKLERLLMLCKVAHTASIKVLIPHLLTCVAYLVTFNINTMCTRVLHCDACVAMS